MIRYRKSFSSQSSRRVNESRRYTKTRRLYEYYGMSEDEAQKLKKRYGNPEFPEIPILVIDNMLLQDAIEDMAYQEAGDDNEITDELRLEQLVYFADEEQGIIERTESSQLHFSIHRPYDTDWCIVVSIDEEDIINPTQNEIKNAIALMRTLKQNMGRFPTFLVK